MGAATFITEARGKTAQAAFDAAVRQAQYDYGHAGYTGTIAEKDDFIMLEVPENMTPQEFADKLYAEGDPRIDDKWGPAGCIDKGGGEYIFTGWASE